MEEVLVVDPPPRLVPAIAAYVQSPRHAQEVLRTVNAVFPLDEESEHLKRIRKVDSPTVCAVAATDVSGDGSAASACPTTPQAPLLEVLVVAGAVFRERVPLSQLIPTSSSTVAVDPAVLGDVCVPFTEALARKLGDGVVPTLQYHLCYVPDHAPRQKPEEWRTFNQYWPFAVPKPSPPEPLPEPEERGALRVMGEVILPLCTALRQRAPQQLPIAAAVVDPRTWDVLYTSKDCDTMARCNSAACCPYPFACPAADGGAQGSPCAAPTAVVLEHPVMYVLKQLATRQARGAEGGESEGNDGVTQQCSMSLSASKPYLANELDLFVSHEPCVMCAMALVHSRIRRAYFAVPNPVHGGLGSVFAVHAIPSLNHHFRAFHCTTLEEAFSVPDGSHES